MFFLPLISKQASMGLSIHQSAAFVLARRGLGFEEKIPKELLLVLFAKEAKKGQPLSDLFKHWKVGKKWHDDLLKKMKKIKMNVKHCFLQDFIVADISFNSEIEFPF